MARKKACFASAVCCADDFLDLPSSAQALYFQLGFEADSDGALDGIKSIVRKCGSSMDDLDVLAEGGYLLYVDEVPFIKHWPMNNRTDNRNYRPGGHPAELAKLIKSDGMPYELREFQPEGNQPNVSLTSDANTKQSNTEQPNTEQPNTDKEKAMRNARCPQCGFEALSSINEIGDVVIDCHNCGEISTVSPFSLRQ